MKQINLLAAFFEAVFYIVLQSNYLFCSNLKIIHTWKKTGKGWLIIGGMGANK